MALFGGKGESGSDRLAKSQATHAAVHNAGAGLFQGNGVQKAPGQATGTGGVPSLFLPTAAQERRKAADLRPAPSILPKSAAHGRREAAAAVRSREEAAGVIRRAAAAKAQADAAAHAAEVTRKAAEVERAREAAAALKVRRAAHVEACRRTLDINATLPVALSALDRRVFALLTVRYTDAGDRPVKLLASDVAEALEIREAAGRAAIDSLREHGAVVDVTDSFGVTRLMPAAHVKAKVTAGARRQ